MCAAAFTAGFFTHKCTQRGAVSSYGWALDTINKNYYFGGVEDGFTDTALSAIAQKYLDRYSQYYTAEQYAEVLKSNSGSKSGIGITYSFVDGKGVYISSVTGNSPAYMCGLRAGEWLKSGSVSGGEIKQFNSLNDFTSLVASAGDGASVNLNSADGKTYVTAKSEYTASYTYMCTNSTAWIFGDAASGGLALYERADEKISYLPDGFAYIRLDQFYGTAAAEFYRLVEKFNEISCTSLILDLRSDGGGYVNVMQDIAGCFTDGEKTAMISRDKKGREERYLCASVKPSQRIADDTDVYVLANSGTASASEALIGAMICYGALGYRDVFLSEYSEEYMQWLSSTGQELKTAQSFGKGIMQSTFVNDRTGEALKLTTAKIYWPDGNTCIHDKGLTVADGCTPVYAEWQHTKSDAELLRAVEIITSR